MESKYDDDPYELDPGEHIIECRPPVELDTAPVNISYDQYPRWKLLVLARSKSYRTTYFIALFVEFIVYLVHFLAPVFKGAMSVSSLLLVPHFHIGLLSFIAAGLFAYRLSVIGEKSNRIILPESYYQWMHAFEYFHIITIHVTVAVELIYRTKYPDCQEYGYDFYEEAYCKLGRSLDVVPVYHDFTLVLMPLFYQIIGLGTYFSSIVLSCFIVPGGIIGSMVLLGSIKSSYDVFLSLVTTFLVIRHEFQTRLFYEIAFESQIFKDKTDNFKRMKSENRSVNILSTSSLDRLIRNQLCTTCREMFPDHIKSHRISMELNNKSQSNHIHSVDDLKPAGHGGYDGNSQFGDLYYDIFDGSSVVSSMTFSSDEF